MLTCVQIECAYLIRRSKAGTVGCSRVSFSTSIVLQAKLVGAKETCRKQLPYAQIGKMVQSCHTHKCVLLDVLHKHAMCTLGTPNVKIKTQNFKHMHTLHTHITTYLHKHTLFHHRSGK